MDRKLREFTQALEADESLGARFEEICALQDVREVRVRTLELAREAGFDLLESDLAPASALDEESFEQAVGGSISPFIKAEPEQGGSMQNQAMCM